MHFDENTLLTLTTSKVQQEFYDDGFQLGGSFGVRVSRSGRRVFFLIYRAGEKRRRVTLGTFPIMRLAEAKEKATRILRYGQPDLLPETFAELCEMFIRQGNLDQLSQKTKSEYQRIIERELIPRWSNIRLQALSRANIVALAESISIERKSPIMAERTVALVSRIFNFAVERELIAANVARNIKVKRASEKPVNTRVLEWPELEVIWNSTSMEPPGIRSAIRFLILSGQMISTISSMRWSDIELDDWLIRRPDGGQRMFPLSPQAQQLLRELRPYRKSDVVFSNPKGEEIAHLRKSLLRVVERAMLKKSCTTLDIRRFVEYSLRGMRVRPDVIDQLFGRTSRRPIPGISVEYDYREEMRAVMSLWGRKVFEHTNKSKPKKKESNIISLFPD